MHHVGPNRLQVHLNRILAGEGFLAFRFDLSGIGDSEVRRGLSSVEERSVSEIQEAMDYLQSSYEIDHFVLVGLCTGADNSHRAAVADERVCGAILIDGYTYPTLKYLILRFGTKFLSFHAWIGLIRRLYASISKDSHSKKDFEGISYFWLPPPKRLVTRQLKLLVARQVQLLQVFTGSYSQYIYKGQFRDAFRSVDFEPFLEVEYFEHADHTFSLMSDRKKLTRLIVDWMNTRFPAR